MALCVLLNGPPGSGKDTLAARLGSWGFDVFAFKTVLYEETAKFFECSVEELIHRNGDRYLKEQKWPGYDKTPREMLIHVSEDIIKPRHGDTFFGEAAAETCNRLKTTLAVFSDSGFQSEIPPLTSYFSEVIVVQLHRSGFSFEGDSRGYVEGPDGTYPLVLVNGDVDGAFRELLDIVEKHLF